MTPPARLRTVRVVGADPGPRAAALAAGIAPWLPDVLAVYDRLFAAAGLEPERVRRLALAARHALTGWAPDLAAELDLLADAASLPHWRIHALNARTELLAAAGATSRGECSAVAATSPAGVVGAQTWDWHRELSGGWAVLEYPQARYPFVTLTEAGLLAKIGINSAGVGVLFNILAHRSDTGEGGVPVHAVARRILDSAADVEAGIAILRSAPLSASSCFTLLDRDRVACLEASPAGVAELPPARWSVHTNHFQDPGLAAGALLVDAESDSVPRQQVLLARSAGAGFGSAEVSASAAEGSASSAEGSPSPAEGLASAAEGLASAAEGLASAAEGLASAAEVSASAAESWPSAAEGVADLLCAHEADGAAVCCHPATTAPLGTGWQTLATVALEPAGRRLSVLAGGPCGLPEQGWRRFRAG